MNKLIGANFCKENIISFIFENEEKEYEIDIKLDEFFRFLRGLILTCPLDEFKKIINKNKNDLFVVLSGHYEKEIEGIFSTENLAQSYIKSLKENNQDLYIKPSKLDPYKNEIENNLKPYFVRISKDKELKEINHEETLAFPLELYKDFSGNFVFSLWAKDETEAIEKAGLELENLLNQKKDDR